MNDEPRVTSAGRGAELRQRTKAFALAIIGLYSRLPKSAEAQVIGRQVLRSGTSVGAHYREAHRARSDAEFVSKIEGGLQELDETMYWLELLSDARLAPAAELQPVLTEASELTAIFVASVRTVKRRNGRT
jgi:four helix bundle protein